MGSDPAPADIAGPGAADRAATPIFILAAPGSQAAMVGAMLGRNERAFSPPELNLFASDTLEGLWSDITDREQVRIHGLLRTVAQLFAGEQTIAGIAMARRWLVRRLHWPTSRAFSEIVRKAAPARVVEKSRSNARDARAMQRIHAAVPNAVYLHLVRHPRAQGAALLAARGDGAAPGLGQQKAGDGSQGDPQEVWLAAETRIADFLAGVPAERQALLRLEDLYGTPKRTLRQLCGKLGLSDDPAAIAAMLRPEKSPFAGPGPFGAHLGDDPQFLGDPRFKKRRAPAPSLEGPLEWRDDGGGFVPEVAERAAALGYA